MLNISTYVSAVIYDLECMAQPDLVLGVATMCLYLLVNRLLPLGILDSCSP